MAESHREDVAGRGAAAKSYREDAAGWGAEAALMAGRGAVAELLAGRECHGRAAGRQLQKGITAQKKRVTPKPSWTCGSPSCLLTTCYGCLRFAII